MSIRASCEEGDATSPYESEGREEDIVRCVCGATRKDESNEPWIACDQCHVRQHVFCVGVSTFEIEYSCEQCKSETQSELSDDRAEEKNVNGGPTSAAGSKHSRDETTQDEEHNNRSRVYKKKRTAEIQASMDLTDPFAYSYTCYMAKGCKITRNAAGELVQVSSKPGALLDFHLPLVQLGKDGRRTVRISVDLSLGLDSKNEEGLSPHKPVTQARSKFEATYYTWDEVSVFYGSDGGITLLTPKDPTASNINFIVKSASGAGTVCKIDCSTSHGVRTHRAMCTALSHGTGVTHATVETYYFTRLNANDRIMSLLPQTHLQKLHVEPTVGETPSTPKAFHPPSSLVKARFQVDMFSNDELDNRRNDRGDIIDLVPKDRAKSSVNFISTNPDRRGYVVKYDSSPEGKKTKQEAQERLGRRSGCTTDPGLIVPVPGQAFGDPMSFQWVQTMSPAKPRPAVVDEDEECFWDV